MLTERDKSSAIDRVLNQVRQGYISSRLVVEFTAQGLSLREREHPQLIETLALVRKSKALIAEMAGGHFSDDPYGLQEFEKAVRPIVQKMFEEKLGPSVELDFRTQQTQAKVMSLGFANMLKKIGGMEPSIRASLFAELQASLEMARRTPIHLRVESLKCFPGVGEGIRLAAKGDMSKLPESPTWDELLCLAVMIDGYEVIKRFTTEEMRDYHLRKEAEYQKAGSWSGTIPELWVVLFYYNRQNHWNNGYGFEEGERGRILAYSAYHALRSRMMNPAEAKELNFITNTEAA